MAEAKLTIQVRARIMHTAEFYASAYTKAELLACERPRGTPDCVVLQIRRPWHIRRENVWVDPWALPPYEARYLEMYAR